MLARYSKNSKGKLIKLADVYLKEEHGIGACAIDKEAYAICKQLINAGAQAYIVGGAIRDLLLGREPKDWDIVTDEHPSKIRKIFKRSRIIGKRFKLVHVVGIADGLFEVATFRSRDITNDEQPFGSLEEDAFRRDFTLNALYYDVIQEQIIDFHGGFKHIQERVIYPVVPLKETFLEDPVRMIRAIKSAQTSQSRLSTPLAKSIKKHAKLLATSSTSRLSEELLKILVLPEAADFLYQCYGMNLLGYWIPAYTDYIKKLSKEDQKLLWQHIRHPDLPTGKRFKNTSVRHQSMYGMLYPYIKHLGKLPQMQSEEIVVTLKNILLPVVFPNKDLFHVIKMITAKEGLPVHFFKEQDYVQRKRLKKELIVAESASPVSSVVKKSKPRRRKKNAKISTPEVQV